MSFYFPSSTASWVSIPVSGEATQDLTVCLWGRLEASTARYRVFFNTQPGGLYLATDVDGITSNFGTDLTDVNGPQFVIGQWYHLGYSMRFITNQNVVIQGYINGQRVATANLTGSTFFNWTSMVIGNDAIAGAQSLLGYVSDVRVFKRAMQDHEVAAEMITRKPHPAGLLLWMPLSDFRNDAGGLYTATQGASVVASSGYNPTPGRSYGPF